MNSRQRRRRDHSVKMAHARIAKLSRRFAHEFFKPSPLFKAIGLKLGIDTAADYRWTGYTDLDVLKSGDPLHGGTELQENLIYDRP